MDSGALVLAMTGQAAFKALADTQSGDAALLYAHAAAAGGRCSLEGASGALALDAARVQKAATLLIARGLAKAGPAPLEPRAPSPTDIADSREHDPQFKGLCDYFESGLGRVLRKAELETMHHIYGGLGLSAEVLVLLIGWCKESGRLSARELERQAYRWHDDGVDSYDRAAAWLEEQRSMRSREWGIRRLLGISERRPSDTEKKYIEQWSTRGLGDELIRLAYDRTVSRTGRLSWAYMDKILTSWHEQGFETEQQVLEGDKPPSREQKAAPADSGTVEAAVLAQYAARRLKREERLKARLAKVTAENPEFEQLEAQRRLCASRLARAAAGEKQGLEDELGKLAARRAQALVEMGRPGDWLDDRPDCPHCGDRGYIGSRMCQGFKEACAAERQRRESAGKT